MNSQKIQEAIDILMDTLAGLKNAEVPVTLSMTLTKREVEVLRLICNTNVSVPRAVAGPYTRTTKQEVYDLLGKIKVATYSTK